MLCLFFWAEERKISDWKHLYGTFYPVSMYSVAFCPIANTDCSCCGLNNPSDRWVSLKCNVPRKFKLPLVKLRYAWTFWNLFSKMTQGCPGDGTMNNQKYSYFKVCHLTLYSVKSILAFLAWRSMKFIYSVRWKRKWVNMVLRLKLPWD